MLADSSYFFIPQGTGIDILAKTYEKKKKNVNTARRMLKVEHFNFAPKRKQDLPFEGDS